MIRSFRSSAELLLTGVSRSRTIATTGLAFVTGAVTAALIAAGLQVQAIIELLADLERFPSPTRGYTSPSS
ncbi:hypothetical protein [Halobiforma nitratireducens]|uniref:Uncharacterized protein n=1 Tax=Halobiforma nitratireducens JCM 10879 TaxID=1227454 RepID=M0MP62_9EURY|nr:hypothetical protein [Halobiforma nitratireducens]EMA47153.1 hypothetical protein C446_00520 [Halobiforma nitratireducens JCM 10879]